MEALKKIIHNATRRLGVRVMKYPVTPFQSMAVFDLCVQFLMNVRGMDLRFIQVGANDAQYGDPLRKYVLNYPWRGILVEPQPDVFEKLRANYAAVADRLIFENVAIDKSSNELTMYRVPSSTAGSTYEKSISSIDPKVTARQMGVSKSALERTSVPCTTLDKLVQKHEMSAIDLLQIDTEGHDFNVLKTLDLSKRSPLIIQLEHGHLSFSEVDEVVQYLNFHHYSVLFGGHQIDTVAIHASFPMQAD